MYICNNGCNVLPEILWGGRAWVFTSTFKLDLCIVLYSLSSELQTGRLGWLCVIWCQNFGLACVLYFSCFSSWLQRGRPGRLSVNSMSYFMLCLCKGIDCLSRILSTGHVALTVHALWCRICNSEFVRRPCTVDTYRLMLIVRDGKVTWVWIPGFVHADVVESFIPDELLAALWFTSKLRVQAVTSRFLRQKITVHTTSDKLLYSWKVSREKMCQEHWIA